MFAKILQTHACVHIHPNNASGISSVLGIEIPRALEITFHRKGRIKAKTYKQEFPHQLDFDNTEMDHLALPKSGTQTKMVDDLSLTTVKRHVVFVNVTIVIFFINIGPLPGNVICLRKRLLQRFHGNESCL